MKKIVVILLFLGSLFSLSAKYITGLISCKYKNGDGYTYFVVLGTGTNSPTNRFNMVKFLQTKYSSSMKKYCQSSKELYNLDLYVYKSKREVVKKFEELIEYCYSYDSNARKTFKIKFYHEKEWD